MNFNIDESSSHLWMTCRRRVSVYLIGLTFLSLWLVSDCAWAQSSLSAREQFEQGIEYYQKGSFEKAAIAFERAYELKPSYKILYNLALAEVELEHFAAALVAFENYLRDGGSEISEGRQAEVSVEVLKIRNLVGSIEINGAPVGAVVIVNREARGKTPLDEPILLEVGKHEIVVELGTHRIFERVVKIAGGDARTVQVGASIELSPWEKSQDNESVGSEGEGIREKRKSLSSGIFWTAAAVSVGAAAGLIATDVSVHKAYKDAKRHPDDRGLRDDVRRLQKLEWGFVGLTAAAALATGILAFIVDFDSKQEGGKGSEGFSITGASGGCGIVYSRKF